MDEWERIVEMYKIAATRIGTPYADFGINMLNIVRRIQADEHLGQLEPDTAMWTLTLNTASNGSQSIHLSWDNGKYAIYLTGNKSQLLEVQLEEAIDIINKYALGNSS